VVIGKKPGRTVPTQRILAMHLGLAIEDVVAAVEIHQRATTLGPGTRLPL